MHSERLFPVSTETKALLVHFLAWFTTDCVFGSADDCRRLVLGDLKRRAENTFGGGGLFVHTPPGTLPYFTCMESEPADADYFMSRLIVVWFQDELPRNLQTTVGEHVYGVDWAAYAEDCHP